MKPLDFMRKDFYQLSLHPTRHQYQGLTRFTKMKFLLNSLVPTYI